MQHDLEILQHGLASPDPERRYENALAILEHQARHAQLSAADVSRVVEVAREALAKLKVDLATSRRAARHGAIHLALAKIRARDGRSWSAVWETTLAHHLGADAPLATARAALRRGNATIAIEAFSMLSSHEARLGRVRALRLSGRIDEAAAAASELGLSLTVDSPLRAEYSWETICRDAQKTQNLTRMANAVARSGSHRSATHMLEASLWAKAIPSKQFLVRIPKADSIRKQFPDDVKKPAPQALLYECAWRFDRLYADDSPMHERLVDVGELMERVPRLGDLAHELLAWAVTARWLVRAHQNLGAELAIAEYRALSLRLSDGTLPDCLGLTADLAPKTWARFEDAARAAADAERATLDRVKTSRIARAAELTKLAVAAGGSRLKSKMKGLGADAETKQKIANEWRDETILRAVDCLTRLKGPMVKFGQILGLLMPSLPPPVQEALASLRDSTTPLPASIIRARVVAELGAPIETLFASWSDEPLAAASIGQLHRARLQDGRDVVVKVQYPGIREAIEADMAMLRALAVIARSYFPRANIDELLDLSHHHFLEECDYRIEAKHQAFAREINRDDPEVLIPEVIHSHSTGIVLTMEFVAGASYAEFAANATPDEIDSAARVIYTSVWRSFLRHGFLNGDPHPGNFLFLADGRVAFLDFGFASHYRAERIGVVKSLLHSVITDDIPLFDQTIAQIGIAVPGQPFDHVELWQRATNMMSAIRTPGKFRFSRRSVMENFENATIKSSNRAAMRLPLEDAMLLRLSWCLQAVLSDLAAEGDWGAIMRPLVYDSVISSKESALDVS